VRVLGLLVTIVTLAEDKYTLSGRTMHQARPTKSSAGLCLSGFIYWTGPRGLLGIN
jgi:hypothetical protein